MKEQLNNFLETYKLQKKYLDKDDNYDCGKNFVDWYVNESGNLVKKLNIHTVIVTSVCDNCGSDDIDKTENYCNNCSEYTDE